jgi:hypothetical protein
MSKSSRCLQNQWIVRWTLLQQRAVPLCLDGCGAAGGGKANQLILFDNLGDGWTKDKKLHQHRFLLECQAVDLPRFCIRFSLAHE